MIEPPRKKGRLMNQTDDPITVVVAIYGNNVDGTLALATLERMEANETIAIQDAAVLVREEPSGRLKIEETAALTAKKGALKGAVAGGIIGVIFPPAVLAMGAIGAVAGAALGHFRDHGFKSDLLKELGEEIPRGGSCVVVVVEERWKEELTAYVGRSGTVKSYPLDGEASAKLLGRHE